MMDFDQLVAPIGRESFFENYGKGSCILMRGEKNRFADLISLDDIELRLNDGCNTVSPIQIISEGQRISLVEEEVAWAPFAIKKAELLQKLRDRHSFMMMNMSQINPQVAHLVDSIEVVFAADDMRADMHLYVSSRADATGYDAHRDYPQHKLYLQVVGSTHWQVFEPAVEIPSEVRAVPQESEQQQLRLLQEFDMKPGDVFYMPPAVFHKVRNMEGPRISLSIPFAKVSKEKISRMDRTYIPFKEIFEADS